MTIAEQIAALEETRKEKAARMNEVVQKSMDESRSMDDSEADEFDTIEGEVKRLDADLKRLRNLERMQADNAKAVEPAAQKHASAAASPSPHIQMRKPEDLDQGIAFARLAKVKALARLDGESPRHIAKQLYGEESSIFRMVNKAAVSAMDSSGGLVGDETSAFADFVEFLRPQTIIGRFGTNGIPSLRRVPFRVPLIGQTSGGSGYWVGEGRAKPLTKFDFERKTLEPLKVANIAVCTEEVLRDSSPSAEMIVRDQLAAALRERMDIDFIDPSKALVAGISPASITNGVTAITSSGSTAGDIRQDIRALFSAFIADNNAPTNGVWIMPSTIALSLSLMMNPLGQNEFPGISMNGGSLFGLPVIVSQYVPSDSSGAMVALVNASDIYMADDGGISVDMSREASLEMNDSPSHNSTTPTPSQSVSMFQTNSVAFRAERTLDWMARRTSAVAVLDGVNWGASA